MLITNYSYINQICGHNHSGTTNALWIYAPHVMRGYYGKQNNDITTTKLDSFPTGNSSPYSYMMADGRGLITATTTLYQLGILANANLAGGLNGESTLDGTSTLTAELGALAYLISTIVGTSTLSADIQGAVEIAATLAGNGDLTGALGALVSILADLNGDGELTGDIAGALSAVATLAGDGNLVAAIQGAVEIVSTLTGTSDLTSAIIGNWDMIVTVSGTNTLIADITALAFLISNLVNSGTITLTSGAVTGDMTANISSFSELSPENLAAAIWNSIAASYNTSGTMGDIMNSIGSGTDPWSTVLPGTYTGDQAGAIVDRLETLIKQVKSLTAAGL